MPIGAHAAVRGTDGRGRGTIGQQEQLSRIAGWSGLSDTQRAAAVVFDTGVGREPE
jgi:hypothetical protein